MSVATQSVASNELAVWYLDRKQSVSNLGLWDENAWQVKLADLQAQIQRDSQFQTVEAQNAELKRQVDAWKDVRIAPAYGSIPTKHFMFCV
jgi:hypothetical protein